MSILTWIADNWQAVLVALSAVVSAAAAIAAITPTPKDDGIVAVLRKIVDVLAFNFGNAKNAK